MMHCTFVTIAQQSGQLQVLLSVLSLAACMHMRTYDDSAHDVEVTFNCRLATDVVLAPAAGVEAPVLRC